MEKHTFMGHEKRTLLYIYLFIVVIGIGYIGLHSYLSTPSGAAFRNELCGSSCIDKVRGSIPGLAVFITLFIVVAAVFVIIPTVKVRRDQSLDAYVKSQLQQGFSKDHIREKLLSVGWKDKVIDSTFRQLEK